MVAYYKAKAFISSTLTNSILINNILTGNIILVNNLIASSNSLLVASRSS